MSQEPIKNEEQSTKNIIKASGSFLLSIITDEGITHKIEDETKAEILPKVGLIKLYRINIEIIPKLLEIY